MKIENFNIKSFNLTKLYLLKYKIYKNFSIKDSLILNFLKYTEFTLKQSLNLIYSYHFKKKKILFIGSSYSKKINFFLRNYGHILLPKSLWSNGSIKNNLPSDVLFYKKKPNLIVFFDNTETDFLILKELDKLKIPVIVFGDFAFSTKNKYYSVLGNSEKTEIKKFFQFLIYSVIKTAK